MDAILSEFLDDLNRVLEQLELIEKLKRLASEPEAQEKLIVKPVSVTSEVEKETDSAMLVSSYLSAASQVWQASKQAHSSLSILEGTLVLYVAGRFEEFVRSSVEDLSDRLISRLGSFTALPKAMQENLIRQTAAVMMEPRKYGHAENSVRAFVTTLAANFSNQRGVGQSINSQCLSITEANMRPEVFADLFKRLGVKEIWKTLGQQASMLAFFSTAEPSFAESNAKRVLNDLMEDRNRVAHPSGSINWPSSDTVKGYVLFLIALGSSLSTLIPVFEVSLGTVTAVSGGN